MTRARLRKPTSKSIATVLKPSWARPVATLALVVVLPTPPLPEVMTTTLDTRGLLWKLRTHSTVVPPHCQIFCSKRPRLALAVLEPDLGGLAAQRGRDLLGAHVRVGDGDQLGFQLLDEDACARQPVGAGDRASAQLRVDVHVPIGD